MALCGAFTIIMQLKQSTCGNIMACVSRQYCYAQIYSKICITHHPYLVT